MKIQMKLLTDAIFGNGMSIPGGEDISVLSDEYGFPYYKGGTFKGTFREEMERYLYWTGKSEKEINETLSVLLGEHGDKEVSNKKKLFFSDFQLSPQVKQTMLKEIGEGKKEIILDSLTHIRTFTSISEDGTIQKGSLRNCRCINKGLYFYSEVQCSNKEIGRIEPVFSLIKWIGSMRNRGFGKVQITIMKN